MKVKISWYKVEGNPNCGSGQGILWEFETDLNTHRYLWECGNIPRLEMEEAYASVPSSFQAGVFPSNNPRQKYHRGEKEIVNFSLPYEEGWKLMQWVSSTTAKLRDVVERFLKQKATYAELRQAVKKTEIGDLRQEISELLSILPYGMDESSGE